MSTSRHFKKLVHMLEKHLRQLMIDLVGTFRIGKPISPEERLAKADQLLKLARLALNLFPIFHELEEVVERVSEQRELFAKANKLNNNYASVT